MTRFDRIGRHQVLFTSTSGLGLSWTRVTMPSIFSPNLMAWPMSRTLVLASVLIRILLQPTEFAIVFQRLIWQRAEFLRRTDGVSLAHRSRILLMTSGLWCPSSVSPSSPRETNSASGSLHLSIRISPIPFAPSASSYAQHVSAE